MESSVPPPPQEWVHMTGNPTGTGESLRSPSESITNVNTNGGIGASSDENGDSGRNDVRSPPAKRRREEKERTRVSRACDRCKKKKTRCTGRCPCPLCLKSGLPCEFTASYTRGRVPSVIVDENAIATANARPRISMPTPLPAVDQPSASTTPPSFQLPRLITLPPMNLSSPAAIFARDRLLVPNPNEDSRERSRDATSRTSPEPPQTDLQGHYVGPASGVSFLLRIQKRLHQNTLHSHDSSIFTFGDAPLPEFDPTFFVLPPKADAQKLVGRYFDFAAPTHRFMHRPSVEQMLDEFYETQGNMRNKDDAPSKTALLLIVLAQAKAYSGLDTLPNDHSARYFFASERQLSKERGAVRLASVQARLGQCFYLLSQSRINHCWSLFGTMAHLAFAIGLNRGRGAPSANIDYVEVESRRRCFWIAYVLDKYLAAALGRPRTFKDEDIDQELPTVVHDSDLLPHSITPAPLSSYEIPLSMAPIEHIKISRIVSLVLKDLYAINPPPTHPQRLALAAHHTASLQQWRSNLTRFLDTTELPSSVLIPIYQRQRNVLNLAYYHAVILINRPFLLSNFANLTRKEGSKAAGPDTTTKENVQACLDAAMGIVRVIDDYSASGTQLVRAFWFTQYYAFCAVVVLYVYRIQQHIVDPGKCEGYFSAGQRCQAVLEGISETDCLSKRYCVVLEELRLEAARRTTTTTSTDPAESATMTSPSHAALTTSSHILAIPPLSSPQRDPSPASFSNLNAPYYGPAVAPSLPTPESALFNQNFAMSPNSIMADLTSWGQFDSLVTAGMGGMIDAGAGGLGINAGGTGDLGFTFG